MQAGDGLQLRMAPGQPGPRGWWHTELQSPVWDLQLPLPGLRQALLGPPPPAGRGRDDARQHSH